MVEIIHKRIHQIGDSAGVILPAHWLRKFHLKKGNKIRLIITDNLIGILDLMVDLDETRLKEEFDAVKKTWALMDERNDLRWIKKRTSKELAQLREIWEEYEELGLVRAAKS